MTFAARLRQLREEANLNQTELAHIIGVSRSAIAMYELGEREPDFEVEESLADFFNVPIDYLRGRQDNATFLRPPVIDGGLMAANTVRIAGRDGSYVEKKLSDDQVDLIRRMVEQLPDYTD